MKRTKSPFYVRRTFILSLRSLPPHGTSSRSLRSFNAYLLTLLMLAVPIAPLAAPTHGVVARDASRIRTTPTTAQSSESATTELGLNAEDPPLAPAAVSVTATLTDDIGLAAKKNPGDIITYTATIMTGGSSPGDDATGVVFTSKLDDNTTLVLNSLNAQPIARTDTYTATGNVPISIAAPGVLTNDIDPMTGTNAGLTVTEVQGLLGNVGAATDTTATGAGGVKGSVTLSSTGDFTYEPPPGYVGNDTFTYKTSEGTLTDTNTVTITISNMVWFIRNTGGGSNRGTFSNPFTSINSFNTANAVADAAPNPKSGDFISLRSGTYNEADGVNLRNTQKLIGEAVQFSSVFTADANSNSAYGTFAGGTNTAPTINTTAGNGIDLADSNTVRGLNVGTTPGFFGFNGTAVGSPIINTVNKTGTGGAINISTSGTFGATVSFGTLESSSSPGANINLVGVTGTLGITSGGTGLTGSAASSNAININGGSVGFTYPGNVTKGSLGSLLNVSNGHSGTLTFNTGTLSATSGTGLQFSNADGTYNFNGTTTLNGGDAGVDIILGSGGTFAFGGTTITNPSGIAFNVDGTTTAVTGGISISGAISKDNDGKLIDFFSYDTGTATISGNLSCTSTCDGVEVTNDGTSSGIVNFSGGTKTLNTSASTAVNLDNNGGGSVNFTGGGLDIDTTTVTGFNATGGGTITLTTGANPNTINSGTGTALNVANTNIGASDLTFESITSNGGSAAGIVLNTTGSAGGLHVLGTGSAGSGGTIANKSGADIASGTAPGTWTTATVGTGLILNNTAEVQLDRMQLNDFSNYAIYAIDVAGLSFTNSTISGTNGGNTAFDESAMFLRNCSGTITLTSINVSGGFDNNLFVLYDSGTADTATYNVTSSTFHDIGAGTNAMVNLTSTTAASASSNVTFNFGSSSNAALGNTFDNSANQNPAPPPATQWFSDGILVTFEGPFQHTLNVDKNTFFELFQAMDMASNFSADVDYRIYDNTISFTEGVGAIAFGSGSSSTAASLIQALIEDNDIGTVAGGDNSGSRLGLGIVGDFRGAETARVTMHQNVIRNTEVNGIQVISQAAAGDGDVHLRVTNNTVDSIDDNEGGGFGVIYGIEVTTNSATNGDIFADIRANDSHNVNAFDIRVRQATLNNTFSLEDFAGTGTLNTSVEAFLLAQNPGNTTNVRTGASVVNYTSQNLNNTNTPAPLTPLMAAQGGVEAALGSFDLLFNDVRSSALTQAELDPLVAAAMDRWSAAGLTRAQTLAMRELRFELGDLAGSYLGEAGGNRIVVDRDAGGKGWFVDATPADDVEFDAHTSATRLYTNPFTSAAGRIDLLTAIEHEIGHKLGLIDSYSEKDRDNLMYGYLTVGERRVPAKGQAIGAQSSALKGSHFLSLSAKNDTVKRSSIKQSSIADKKPLTPESGETVTVNGNGSGFTLPGGDSVTITFQATVNTPPLARTVQTQGKVSGTNFTLVNGITTANPNTNDPETAAVNDATVTNINTTVTWDGSTSADWNDATNWTPAFVPNSVSDVIIPTAPVPANEPTLTPAAVTVFSLDLQDNRTLSIDSGDVLNVTTGLTTLAGALTGGPYTLNFTSLTINRPTGITLNGNTSVSGVLTLTSGVHTVTPTNTLTLTGNTLTYTAGYIKGNFNRTLVTSGTAFLFPVGTDNGYSPVNVTVTAGSGTLTVLAVQGPQPVLDPTKSLARYWTLTEGGAGITANLVFNYNDPPDVVGTEANYRVTRVSGSTAVTFKNAVTCPASGTPCVNPATNTATIDGVSNFSDWTVAEPAAPTASDGVVTGRIVADNGAAVEGAVVRLSGAQNRKFITDANGVYRFDNVETGGFYNVTPSRVNYTFSPAVISFSQLGETTEAAFGATATGGSVNPLDTPEYFVRQNYLDFLGREPDEAGFNFWSDQILGCGDDADCVDRKRTHVSAAYFLSIEFQETGGLVDGLYRASYGRRPSYGEFRPDAAAVAPALVVGSDGWQTALENGKTAFVDAFVQRAAFQSAYGGLANDAYVDALIANTGASFTGAERNALVSGLAGGMTRAAVLRAIVEDADVVAAKRNSAFVMMEYFGYLRREPDAAGYQFWLDKLNHFNGNFEQAEMVRAFIVSQEYRDRFPR